MPDAGSASGPGVLLLDASVWPASALVALVLAAAFELACMIMPRQHLIFYLGFALTSSTQQLAVLTYLPVHATQTSCNC